jgi:hypothetical protein
MSTELFGALQIAKSGIKKARQAAVEVEDGDQ